MIAGHSKYHTFSQVLFERFIQGAELVCKVGWNVPVSTCILRLTPPNFMWVFSQPCLIRSYKKNLVQPQSGLSRGFKAKTVRNTLSPHQNAKKRTISVASSLQIFYPLTTVFKASKSSFRPNLLDLEKKFWFCLFHDTFLAPEVCTPKMNRND